MLALIKGRVYDDIDGVYQDWYTLRDNCETYAEAAEYADEIFGKELEIVQIEIIDTGLYVDAEVFEKLKGDYYFQQSIDNQKRHDDPF